MKKSQHSYSTFHLSVHFIKVLSMQTNKDSFYHSKGLPLNCGIAQKLIIEVFSGQRITRQTIIKKISSIHLARGGKLSAYSDVASIVKPALTKLKKKGLAENPNYGSWQIISPSYDLKIEELVEVEEIDNSYENESTEELNTQTEIISNSDVIIGVGNSSVYVYYLPIYRIMAENNGESVWQCKIGRTDRDPLGRILAQASTALPEKPHLALIVKTRDPASMEKAIHSVLKLRGQHIKNSPGSEWFLTSPDEVLALVKLFDPTLNK